MLTDSLAALAAHLRADAAVAALVDDRVYTAAPNSPTWPLVLLRRSFGTPDARPAHVDRPGFTIYGYGGTQRQARNIVAACYQAIVAGVGQTWNDDTVVSFARFGSAQGPLFDRDYTPAKPYWLLDVSLTVHPA